MLYSHNFENGHSQTINAVAWAPLAGRSFHMIASCSDDGLVVIWKLVLRPLIGNGEIFTTPSIS